MAASDELRSLVDQMPDPDNRGMFTTNIDKEKIDKAIASIYRGGGEYVSRLIDMLGEPGSDEDVKPRYALHCLANYALVVKDEAPRRQLGEALASRLGGQTPKAVKAFLCQELGWAGGKEAVSALGKLLTDGDLSGPASMALVAIRDGAAAEFRTAWPKATGQSRRHIMDGLAALPEPQSAGLFQQALRDEDREVRIAAAAGLAALGEADSAEPLLQAAATAAGWEKTQATKNCLVLAELLAAAGHKAVARRIYEELRKTQTDDSQRHIREAAERGLAATA